MVVNLRRARRDRGELLRSLGAEIRRLREDAGLSQAAVARVAGISSAHEGYVEAGRRDASVDVLVRLGQALGAELSVRDFPATGPAIRDRWQLAMSEGLLPLVGAAWSVRQEVAVYRPVRGVIDLALDHRRDPATVASELHSELRRVEQQIRWAGQKAGALAEQPEQEGRSVSRLLMLRNSAAMREVARAAALTLGAAYPARTEKAVAALAGKTPWPGAAVVWMRIEGGCATLLGGPPRGIALGR